jgi:tryptophan synthase alpha subunit
MSYHITYKNRPDMDKHLELIAKTRKKYPAIDIYPSLCKETMQMIGISRMIQFCKENKIDDILTIGDYDQDMLDEIKQGGIKNSTEVSYYMTDGEIASAKNATGFIIMQAFPYPEEIQAGYTRERLAECVKALREDFGIQRPIYCAQGIRKLEDIKEIEAAGADGFILGSLLFDHYHDLDSLSRTIHSFKETQ